MRGCEDPRRSLTCVCACLCPPQNVVQFYRHALNLASPAAQLVIEDITHGDPFKAGLTWWVDQRPS
jgi:hypothetical protein